MRLFSQRLKPYMYLLPGLLFVVGLIGFGLFDALRQSVQHEEGSWWGHYIGLFENRAFIDSIMFSIRVTVISTALSLVIGLIVTKLIAHYLVRNQIRLIVWIPMLFPHFIAGYMIVLLFSQSGWFSSLFYQLGWIEELSQFPILTSDRDGIGIIMTYVYKEIPFVVLMLLPVYYQLDPRYKEVVQSLGGSKWDVFKTVELRWLLPVLLETAIILFAFILTAFEVPYFLGATYPQMLSVLSYQWFFEGDWSNRPMALAAMLMVTGTVILLSFVIFRRVQKMRYRMMKGSQS